MPRRADAMSDAIRIRCRLLWKIARRHGWGSPVPADALVRSALESSIQGERHDRVEELLEEPYVGRDPDGYVLRNDRDSQALAAVRLRETCGYSTLQIEATLSRSQQAGGFDAYDESSLRRRLSDWR